MTKLYSEDNLFTTFNNIEKIKKSKEERKLNKVIRVEEMIKAIKEHYNLNAPMLAHNLGVDVQAIYRWEKGGRPNIKRYNKIKELYEEIAKEDETETLEQPETTLKPLEIANKEILEDVTAGTPFIKLSLYENDFFPSGEPYYVNYQKISEIVAGVLGGSSIHFKGERKSGLLVEETPTEVLELIRKTIKENEKN
uniref:Antitoxin n=1 Tax=Siphoviridae sp. ctJjf17 TaxID=2827839 RepID=A0A8S5SAY1_9CAUD|nr:MAG TPA: antitoxin [Siphoviridae sp. ctJjf17]